MRSSHPELTRRRLLATMATVAAASPIFRKAMAGTAPGSGPLWVSCRADLDRHHRLTGFDALGSTRFDLALPARGHAMALHPTEPLGVVFARRPGTYAVVFDHDAGVAVRSIAAADGRHFEGHGAFSEDGRYLFTTENDFERQRGMIGVRDAADGYRQLAEFESFGIGCHELIQLPGSPLLAVANGGTLIHPDHEKQILNIDSMRPSLALVDPTTGHLADRVELEPALHQNSIRHIAVARKGAIAFGMQFAGTADRVVPLVGVSGDGGTRLFHLPPALERRAKHYIGSLAVDAGGTFIAASSPRGGLVVFFEGPTGRFLGHLDLADGCGVSPTDSPAHFLLSAGTGRLVTVDLSTGTPVVSEAAVVPSSMFDNHMRLVA